MKHNGQWRIIVRPKVRRTLKRLPRDWQRRIGTAISQLAEDPRPVGSKKLAGFDNFYRIRVGDWRIVYVIEDDRLLILIIAVGPRGSVYRDL